MSSIRQNKVAALVQKELANYFLFQAKAKFKGAMISVTTVRVTADFSLARVYLSIFGVPDKQEIMKIIEASTKEIRQHFAQQVKKQMRVTPQFIFIIDDSLDYAENIDKLLKKK